MLAADRARSRSGGTRPCEPPLKRRTALGRRCVHPPWGRATGGSRAVNASRQPGLSQSRWRAGVRAHSSPSRRASPGQRVYHLECGSRYAHTGGNGCPLVAEWWALDRVARGESNKQITRALALLPRAVKNHPAGVYQRQPRGAAANTRVVAAVWYLRAGRERRRVGWRHRALARQAVGRRSAAVGRGPWAPVAGRCATTYRWTTPRIAAPETTLHSADDAALPAETGAGRRYPSSHPEWGAIDVVPASRGAHSAARAGRSAVAAGCRRSGADQGGQWRAMARG